MAKGMKESNGEKAEIKKNLHWREGIGSF